MIERKVIVPFYDLYNLYTKLKLFSPLNYYIDFDNLLSLSFDPELLHACSKQKIWEIIDNERTASFYYIQPNFQLELQDDEYIDVMLDIFIDRSQKILNSYFDIFDVLNNVKKSEVKDCCLILVLE